MKDPEIAETHRECLRHLEWEEAPYEDSDYAVELPRPTSRADGDRSEDRRFACRVRRWDIDPADPSKPNIFLVAGIGHNCNFYDPLVTAMRRDESFSARVGRVYALDLPGHGASPAPPNIKFGQLTLAHYVETIRQVLSTVCEETGHVDCVAGHSMGGLLVMLVEQTLRDAGTGMTKEFSTSVVILLAPALPEEIRWPLVEGRFKRGVSFEVLLMLTPYVAYSLRYGPHVRCSNEDFVRQFFSVPVEDESGGEVLVVVPRAPERDEVSVLNDPESYAAMSELAGLDVEKGGTVKRPHVDELLFEEYRLAVASYSKDMLIAPGPIEELCGYLSSRTEYVPVDHPEACHDDPYTCPCLTLELFRRVM